jgi:hypothetical protein
MGLIRQSALEDVGGWAEWCITEDAELSLRLLRNGWSGLHVDRSFGAGVMLLTFEALKGQRFRWCLGGIQILRLALAADAARCANGSEPYERWPALGVPVWSVAVVRRLTRAAVLPLPARRHRQRRARVRFAVPQVERLPVRRDSVAGRPRIRPRHCVATPRHRRIVARRFGRIHDLAVHRFGGRPSIRPGTVRA